VAPEPEAIFEFFVRRVGGALCDREDYEGADGPEEWCCIGSRGGGLHRGLFFSNRRAGQFKLDHG
jgi:hypothetical protein